MNWDELIDHTKTIGLTNQVDSKLQFNLLELVKKFIIRKKLILFGGMSIDYALRLKGEQIYKDYDINDYDVYSSKYITDAEELIGELSLLGYKNVSAIRAMHAQTIRVRCDHIYILDLGYVPDAVLKKIPILKYDGISFVDPIFQYMDMHLSLSFPYGDIPMENITHRWAKDIKRYNILYKKYPPSLYLTNSVQLITDKMIAPQNYNVKTGGGIKANIKKTIEKATAKATAKATEKATAKAMAKATTKATAKAMAKATAKATAKLKRLKNNIAIRPNYITLDRNLSELPPFLVTNKKDARLAISGFGAFAIIKRTLEVISNMVNIDLKTNIPTLDILFTEHNIKIDMPDLGNNNIHFVTYKYFDTINQLKNIDGAERYRQYLDINAEYIKVNNIIIASTEYRLLSASFIHLKALYNIEKSIYVVSIQYLLLFFLYQFHITNYAIYIEYYIHALDMIKSAEEIFSQLLKNAEKLSEDKDKIKLKILQIFNNTVFAPVISSFGDLNMPLRYIFQEAKIINDLNDSEHIPKELEIKNIDLKKIAENTPKGIYINKKTQNLDFLKSSIYNRDGGKCDRIEKNDAIFD